MIDRDELLKAYNLLDESFLFMEDVLDEINNIHNDFCHNQTLNVGLVFNLRVKIVNYLIEYKQMLK